MKKALGFIAALLPIFILAVLFQPSRGIPAAYNRTLRVVDSLGNVLSGGTASATTAAYDETVRIVDSTGHVLDSLGGGVGGAATSLQFGSTNIPLDTTAPGANNGIVEDPTGAKFIGAAFAPYPFSTGDMGAFIYSDASNNLAVLGSNTAPYNQLVCETGTGTAGNPPQWCSPSPAISLSALASGSVPGPASGVATGVSYTLTNANTCNHGDTFTDSSTVGSLQCQIRAENGVWVTSGNALLTSGTSILKGNGSGGFSNAVSGTDYLTPTTGVVHAGSGTLANAFASCPAAAPCEVIADPGNTYNISAQLNVGTGNYAQTLFNNGAIIHVTDTTSTDVGIALGDQGRLVCNTYLKGSPKNGSIIDEDATGNVQAVVANSGAPGGTPTNTHMDVENCNIQGGGTLGKAVLWVSGVDGFGYFANNTIGNVGANNTGVLVDDGTSSGLTNAINFHGLWVALGNVGVAYGMRVTSAHGGVTNVTLNGGSIVDASGAGTTALLSVDTSGSTFTAGFFAPDLYLEVKAGQTGDALLINNARQVDFPGLIIDHNGNPTLTNCVHIEGTNIDRVLVQGRTIPGSTLCTNTVQNDVTSYSDTTAGGFDYTYNKNALGVAKALDQSGIINGFGPGQAGLYYSAAGTAIPTCVASLARTFTCVSDATACTSGTTYTASGSTACLVQCNTAGNAWKETGVACF
jgi:hypothetical protein